MPNDLTLSLPPEWVDDVDAVRPVLPPSPRPRVAPRRLVAPFALSSDTTLPPNTLRAHAPLQAKEMITTIEGKIKELNKMHDKHINTPDFDEQAEEERAIEILTSEITSVRHAP